MIDKFMSYSYFPGFTPWPDNFSKIYRALGYWRNETLGNILTQAAISYPNRIALVCGQRRWTYAELNASADQMASGLIGIGIQPRDRVVVQLPNIAEIFIISFALFRIGAIPVFALPAHRYFEINYFCELTAAVAYVVKEKALGFDYGQLALRIKGERSTMRHIIAIGGSCSKEFISFEDLYVSASLISPPDAHDVALLQLSGGSTGLPKLIPRTHEDYGYSIRASVEICRVTANTVYLCSLPAIHNFALSSPGCLGIFHAGGTVVMLEHSNPEQAFALINTEGVTMTSLVPPLVLVWLDAARSTKEDLSSLNLLQVGGAKLGFEIAKRVQAELGCQLQQVFGMAEGLVNYTRLDDSEYLILSTQGSAISPHDEILIVDSDDIPVTPGVAGNLLVRGPYTIRGYYKADLHNQMAFTRDGYYRTGDIVRQLASGHLIVEGRAKDQINRGGEKIAAEEIENHLRSHPLVHDAAIVSMPDSFLGEKSCAFIVPRNSNALTASEIRTFLKARGLAPFKIPDRFEFVTQLPKTGVGKVSKRILRKRLKLV